MDAGPGYDTSNLQSIRKELRRLNIAAVEARLIRPLHGRPDRPAFSGQTGATAPHDGKPGAARLMAMLRRGEGDDSPSVPGTDFTDAGVVRLLAHLRGPARRKAPNLQRLRRYLTRPVQFGMRVSAGVSVERLQWMSRYLKDVEAYGLEHVQAVSAARRGRKVAAASAPEAPERGQAATATGVSHAPTSGHAESK